MSLADMRAGALAVWTYEDLKAVYERIATQARTSDDPAWARLFMQYAEGMPRKQAARGRIEAFDSERLESIDGCRKSAIDVAREYAEGRISDDEAGIAMKLIDVALRTHHAQRDEEAEVTPRPIHVTMQTIDGKTAEGGE